MPTQRKRRKEKYHDLDKDNKTQERDKKSISKISDQ